MIKTFTTALLYTLFISSLVSQIKVVMDTTGVPLSSNPMEVCGKSADFTFEVSNVSTSTLSDIYFAYDLPSGLYYVPSTINGNGVEYNISDLNVPVFNIADLLPGKSAKIEFKVKAACEVLPITNTLVAKINLSYFDGTSSSIITSNSYPISVKTASLSIDNITNQTINNGIVGDTISRTISIKNSGYGAVASFTFQIIKPSDIELLAISNATYTVNGDTLNITNIDFTSVGDGDTLFEKNEVFVMEERVVLSGCNNLKTDYYLSWGCGNNNCEYVSEYSNISVYSTTPQLEYYSEAAHSGCYDVNVPNTQKIFLVNTGSGPAVDVVTDIYQSATQYHAPTDKFYSFIDSSSIMVSYASDTTKTSAIIDSFVINQLYPCFGSVSNPLAQAFINIPFLASGDTVMIYFDIKTCCVAEDSIETSSYHFDGWNYKVKYWDQCKSKLYESAALFGRKYSFLNYMDIFTDIPSDFNDGDTATVSYFVNNIYLYASDAGWEYKVEFSIPDCFSPVDSSLSLITGDGLYIWDADSVFYTDTSAIGYFNQSKKPGGFNPNKNFFINLDIYMQCGLCTGDSINNLSMQVYYTPNLICGCSSIVADMESPVTPHCITSCPDGGVWTYDYELFRTSLGLPDNDNNSILDSTGTIDLSKIDRNRVMFGDTFMTKFYATIVTTSSNTSWTQLTMESKFSDASTFSFIANELVVFDASENTYFTCTNLNLNEQQDTFVMNIYSDSLTAYLSNGSMVSDFQFENNDSVWISIEYVVDVNIYANMYNITNENRFYALDTLSGEIFTCDNYNSNLEIFGANTSGYGPNEYVVGNCDTMRIQHSFYTAVGPCCNNSAGSNIFPYEYRNWTYFDKIYAVLPQGYEFVYAEILQSRSGEPDLIKTTVPILPTYNGDTAFFDIKSLYVDNGGSNLLFSEDGENILIYIDIFSTCGVVPEKYDTIPLGAYFAVGIEDNFSKMDPTRLHAKEPYDDRILNQAPELGISSTLNYAYGKDTIAYLNVAVKNSSLTSDAKNSWLAFYSPSGLVDVTMLIDSTNSDTLYPDQGLFKLGEIKTADYKSFIVMAKYQSCSLDSIIAYSGWNCKTYPDTADLNSCFLVSEVLYIKPKPGVLALQLVSSPDTTDLCEDLVYEVQIKNTGEGSMENIWFYAIAPQGLYYVQGSSYIKFGNDTNFYLVSDPLILGNDSMAWQINSLYPQIENTGLMGAYDTSFNTISIKLSLTTNCSFIAGFDLVFWAAASSVCGTSATQSAIPSVPLNINGAPIKHYASVKTTTNTINPCDSIYTLSVKYWNLGPETNISNDQIIYGLPTGFEYVSGSYLPGYNADTLFTPFYDSINNQLSLNIETPDSVELGDSVKFSFMLMNKGDLCGQNNVKVYTATEGEVFCVADNDSCNILFLNTQDKITISETTIPDVTGIDVQLINADTFNTEVAYTYYISNHTGADFSDTLFVYFYYDANADNAYNSGDILINYEAYFTFIADSGSYILTDSVVITSGYNCSLGMLLSSSGNLSGEICECGKYDAYITDLVNFPQYSTISDTILCEKSSNMIGVPSTNGLTYLWETNPYVVSQDSSYTFINHSVSIKDTSIYILYSYTVPYLCAITDSFIVYTNPVPDIKLTATDTVICSDMDTVMISSFFQDSNYQYFWSINDSLFNTQGYQGPYEESIAGSTVIVLNITDSICSATDSLFIEKVSPEVFDSELLDTVLCDNSSLYLGIPDVYDSYLWSTGDTTNFVDVTLSGSYFVSIEKSSCKFSDTINIDIISMTLPDMVFAEDTIHSCENEYTLDLSLGNYSYVWSTGDTTSEVSIKEEGYYVVNISNGPCEKKDSVYLSYDNQIIEESVMIAADSYTMCIGDELYISSNHFNPTYQYIWSNGDTSNSIAVFAPGMYWLKVLSGNCYVTDTIEVTSYSDAALFVPNAFSPNSDAYNELFEVQIGDVASYHLEVYNKWGNQVFVSNESHYQWNGNINSLPPKVGTYFWIIEYSLSCNPNDIKFENGYVSVLLE